MLRNLFFRKRPSPDLDTERLVCGKASPSTTPSRASHDNYKDYEGRSVHQLWPLEDHVRSTNFDVVFFHGLHWPSEKEAWKSTWTQLDDPQDCWPQNWLPQDLDENVRVLAISYDACPTQSEEKGSYDDVSEIGQNILQAVVLSDEWRLGRQHGFVLIGHCFGGLVIKSLVQEARKRALENVRNAIDRKAKTSAEMFLKNLKGVVFYAVPHYGSENLISYFSRYNQTTIPRRVVKLAGFMQNVQPHQLKMEKLSTTFDATVEELSVNVYAFLEGKPMKDAGFRLVEKAAALRSAGENYYTLEDCDHSTVCKPLDKNHPSYYFLLDFIRVCRQEERETFLGFEYNWKENFQFYVEPSNLPNILLKNLEEGSKNILVYGGVGYGKTTLVKYVLVKNAELNNIFYGGIFQLKYGQKDNDVLSSQKELIRALQPNPQELQGLECWQIGRVRAKLEELLNRLSGPVLLFIDDVWSEQMIDNSPEFVATKGSKLVVTSRINLKPNQPNWIRIEVNQRTNENAAAQLLASKAANNPNEMKFPPDCEHIAEKLLSKCSGCLLAITIIGAILWENKAQTPEEWADAYAEDYKGEGKIIFEAIKLSLEYGQEESEQVGLENILRTLALFKKIEMPACPAIVIHLAWSYLQPQGEISHFKMLLNRLIARNLVLEWQYSSNVQVAWKFQKFEIPQLVQEYVSMKLHAIDMCNVLEMENQELFTGRKKKIEKNFLLATFLPIWKTRHTNLEFALSLGQFYYENWEKEELFKLLGTRAENAILLASQPHKLVTQVDIEALLHLLNSDKIRARPAACILAQLVDQQLVDQFYGVGILQHKSIQGFIQNLKHQWKTLKDCKFPTLYDQYPCTIALKLVKYRTFAEKFANDEEFMKILTDIIIHNCGEFGCDALNFLFTWCQHKNVRNIFYQNYTKIPMKNILKQISSKLNQETKLFQIPKSELNVYDMLDLSLQYEDLAMQIIDEGFKPNVYNMLDLSLQYEDLAMQIINEGGDDIVLGIFFHLFKFPNLTTNIFCRIDTQLLFSILNRLAKRKEGEAIIIKHVHWLLRYYIFNHETESTYDLLKMIEGFTKLVQHKGIAQALITEERVELLVGALKRGEVGIVPLVLQRLFCENEEFACKVITRGGWRMMTKGLQLMLPYDMFQFSLTHIAREMASKGEIQELIMEVINEDNSEYCLKLLENLVSYHIDIMRDEFIGKGGIQFLLARLTSLNHQKKFQIITSCLLQKMVLDIKVAEKMMAHNGIQVLVQLLVVGLNDYNVNNMYLINIVDSIRLLVKGLEDPMKLLMSSIDDIDILEIHEALLRLPPHDGRIVSLSFLPETLDVDKNIAEELLNFSSLKPPDIIYLDEDVHEDDYQYDCNTIGVLIQLCKHVDIASLIMAKKGILEGFVIQLSKGNLDRYTFELLEVVLQHERVATQVVRQRPSFIKELLQLFPMERSSTFKYQKIYSVASLLFILAKHGGVFIKFIVNSDGIKILLKKASLQNWIGRCNVIEILHIMAKDENHALQIEKAGGRKMLLRAISCYLQYVHDTHLETVIHNINSYIQFNKEYEADHLVMIHSQFITPYIQFNREYEDDRLVMCCLKTLSCLVNHEEIAKKISTRRGDSKEYGIIALVDVMQIASQLWSSITLTLRETIVTKRLMQIKGHMLIILSNVASTLVSMAKLHPHIDISRKVNEDVLKGIFQLEGMVIDEYPALKEALQGLLDMKKETLNPKTWSCQQLRSKTIDIQSYEGKLGECQTHFGVKGTSNEGQSSGTTKEDDD